ncbi:MAG: formylglycine-generating enzyme family protein [Prosthecobacter sp.]
MVIRDCRNSLSEFSSSNRHPVPNSCVLPKNMRLPLCLSLVALLVLSLSQCVSPGTGAEQLAATKEHPFVNSLGMRFVPVPGTRMLMCTTETTVGQYRASGLGYRSPGYFQTNDHPAVFLTWEDVNAWCAWLSRKEGRKYRLPTSAEWGLAAGRSTYPWGEQWPPPPNAGNYAGQEMREATAAERVLLFKGFTIIGQYRDKHRFTAPVGSYRANALGIHDLGGNVWEWVQHRMLRGASWRNDPQADLASSAQYHVDKPGSTGADRGFRVVLVQ